MVTTLISSLHGVQSIEFRGKKVLDFLAEINPHLPLIDSQLEPAMKPSLDHGQEDTDKQNDLHKICRLFINLVHLLESSLNQRDILVESFLQASHLSVFYVPQLLADTLDELLVVRYQYDSAFELDQSIR